MYQTFNNSTRRGAVKTDRVWVPTTKPNIYLTYKSKDLIKNNTPFHKVGAKEKNGGASFSRTKPLQSQDATQKSDNRASISSLIATDVLEETKTRLPNIFNNYFKKTPRSDDKAGSLNLINRPAVNLSHNVEPIVKINNRFPLKASNIEKLKDLNPAIPAQTEELKSSDISEINNTAQHQPLKNEEMLIYIRRIDGRAQMVMFSDSDVRPCDLRHPDHSLAYSDVRAYIRDNELLSPHSLQRIWIWLADVSNCWQYDALSKWFSTSDTAPQPILEPA